MNKHADIFLLTDTKGHLLNHLFFKIQTIPVVNSSIYMENKWIISPLLPILFSLDSEVSYKTSALRLAGIDCVSHLQHSR